MTPAERLATLQRGLTALQWVEDARRAALPPPEREDPALLREIRDVSTLVWGVEMAVNINGLDTESVLARDALLSMKFDEGAVDFIVSLATDSGAAMPYRGDPPPVEHAEALQALAALVARYNAGEFMPPKSYFGIPDAEA